MTSGPAGLPVGGPRRPANIKYIIVVRIRLARPNPPFEIFYVHTFCADCYIAYAQQFSGFDVAHG